MKASAIEFRLRVLIMVILIALGFVAPWIEYAHRITLLEWLALEASRVGLMSFAVATPAVIVLAALIAGVAAFFRVWGTAYLGALTVNHVQMKAGEVLADGPYRYVRNPLYIGSWCMFASISFLMPPSGALVSMILLTVFLFRLILGEEAFLAGQVGEPYRNYLLAVPRLFPLLRSGIPPSGRAAHWLRSVLAELAPIGAFITMAFLSWSYDQRLMEKALLISFGLSFIGRALVIGVKPEPDSTK
jgi:protein-S-isoprenylcysteine O-methyltransferase Ste14